MLNNLTVFRRRRRRRLLLLILIFFFLFKRLALDKFMTGLAWRS
jgi:hypothetical protein